MRSQHRRIDLISSPIFQVCCPVAAAAAVAAAATQSFASKDMVSTSPAFIGGALSFKGDKKKKKLKKKKQTVKHDNNRTDDEVIAKLPQEEEDEMTEAERAAYKKKEERELQQLTSVAKKSHRERVEDFNEKLGQLTEHNDIPRVSAAGNG